MCPLLDAATVRLFQITMEFVLGLYDPVASLEAQKRHEATLAAMAPEDRRGHKR